MATVAASLSGVQSVSFSGPGLGQSLYKFGLSTTNLSQSLTIRADRDIVPAIDEHIGAIQWIRCSRSAVGCHRLDTTICELYRACGSGLLHGDQGRMTSLQSYCQANVWKGRSQPPVVASNEASWHTPFPPSP
jgi:hypothetical protein